MQYYISLKKFPSKPSWLGNDRFSSVINTRSPDFFVEIWNVKKEEIKKRNDELAELVEDVSIEKKKLQNEKQKHENTSI